MSSLVTRGLDRIGQVRQDLHSPTGRRRVATTLVWWCAVVAVATVVGATVGGHMKIGLVAGGLVLVLGIFVADPILLPVIALPASILVQRVGGSSTNLSIADLMVFLGALVSLFHIRWKDARFLKQFLMGVVWYQAILILVVLDHPYRYNVVEWFHRLSYVGGSVLVGWVIASHGRAKQAFRLFLAGSAVLAVIAMEHAVTGHFHPAQWGVYQKNTIGAVLWAAIVIAQVLPNWIGIGKTEARIEKYLCFGGLLASQSRQSLILVLFCLAVAVLLNPEVRRRSKLILAGAIPLVLVLYYSFSLAARNNPKFNSVSIRFDQIGAALHVWHLSPILGLGMRFYNLPQYLTVTPPPNVFIDNLSSTGIVGSLAFVFLFYVTMRTMFRLPASIGTLGLVILLGHYLDGLFDTFWIGASTITPFIVAGACLGAADLARLRGDPVARDPTATDVVRDTILGFPAAKPRDPVGAARRMAASVTASIAARSKRLVVAHAAPAAG
jgi:hypothetical protein